MESSSRIETAGGSGSVDFSRWAVVARKDNTGFGRQAADIRQVLGIGYHFVCPSDRIEGHPPSGVDEIPLPPDMPVEGLRELLARVQGIIFFETYSRWHPELLRVSSDLGVKSVCVPNWEWFNGKDPMWHKCDYFACPTHYTEKVVRGYGWRNAAYVTWPLDMQRFQARGVQGQARLFIHNAGLVDPDDRKGTRDTIRAFMRSKRKDIRLLVRMQKKVDLPAVDSRVEIFVGDIKNAEDLYSTGDVAVQPSKMEGIGFMVIEPCAVGMPVISTNYPPMNEFVQQPSMLVKPAWFKRKAFPTTWIKHAHLRVPSISDLCRKIEWCAGNDLTEISLQNRRLAETMFDREVLLRVWSEHLGAL